MICCKKIWKHSFINFFILVCNPFFVYPETVNDSYQRDIPQSQVLLVNKSKTLIKDKKYLESIEILKNVLQVEPEYYRGLYYLGLAYFYNKQYDDSIHYLEQALTIRENKQIKEYSIFNTLGWIYMANENYNKAEINYLMALRYEEQNTYITNQKLFNNLGLLYYNLSQVELAQKYLKIAVNKYNSQSAQKTLSLVNALKEKEKQSTYNFNIQNYSDIALKEAEFIGNRIFMNECRGRNKYLTFWGKNEKHASMGIGHFIWYPKNKIDIYEETFPNLLYFFLNNGIKLPNWLVNERYCPWSNYLDFMNNIHSNKMIDLRELLQKTIGLQTKYIVKNLEISYSKIENKLGYDKKRLSHIKKQIDFVAKTSEGRISVLGIYALIDYVHFKGVGTSEKERYKNEGWGLLQVLEEMHCEDSSHSRQNFVDAAKKILKKRINNAPINKNEKQYEKGWLKRLNTYL